MVHSIRQSMESVTVQGSVRMENPNYWQLAGMKRLSFAETFNKTQKLNKLNATKTPLLSETFTCSSIELKFVLDWPLYKKLMLLSVLNQ